jgi:hypothetical protein
MNPEDIKANVRNIQTWERALPMFVCFCSHYFIVQTVLLAIMIVQFMAQLLFQRRLEHLYDFSMDLANYDRNLWLFLTYTSDRKLFPFADWRDSCDIRDINPAPSDEPF